MYGVSKITSEQNIMLTTFPGAQYSAQSLAEHLDVFAKAGIVVDMICQSAPRGSAVDFSFTTSYDNFAAVMRALPAAAKANPPLVSGGYSKINLFGEDMVTSCGVGARALAALAGASIEIVLITTSCAGRLGRGKHRDRANHDQRPRHFAVDSPAGRGRRPRSPAQGVCSLTAIKKQVQPHLKGCTCLLFILAVALCCQKWQEYNPIHDGTDCHICPADDLI